MSLIEIPIDEPNDIICGSRELYRSLDGVNTFSDLSINVLALCRMPSGSNFESSDPE